jgi:environmental stress-induced protein Ves
LIAFADWADGWTPMRHAKPPNISIREAAVICFAADARIVSRLINSAIFNMSLQTPCGTKTLETHRQPTTELPGPADAPV